MNNLRIGYGFDVHKFYGTNPLILGGVKIPYCKGILAHSDGDVLIHSLIDALLGASGLGDIGKLFPSTNQNIKNISSCILLKIVFNKIKKFKINNIDITIIAQKPKINKYIEEIKKNISKILCIKIKFINIKATTTETLGFIGRKEGIACTTIVLLYKKK